MAPWVRTSLLGLICALLLVASPIATDQIPVVFEPCRPGEGEAHIRLDGRDFVPTCAEDVTGARIVVRGASAQTHPYWVRRLATSSLLAFTEAQISALREEVLASELYTAIEVTPALGQVLVEVEEAPRLTEIEVIGNTVLHDSELAQSLQLPQGAFVNAQMAADVEAALLRDYQALGYFSARAKGVFFPAPSFTYANGTRLVIFLNEGETAPLSSIQFTGNDTFDEAQLLPLLTSASWTKIDDIDPDQLAADQNRLLDLYREVDLARTGVGLRIVTYDAQGQEVSGENAPASVGLVFEIDEAAFEIGEIQVTGDVTGEVTGDESDPEVPEIAQSLVDSALQAAKTLTQDKVFSPQLVSETAAALSEQLNAQSDRTLGVRTQISVDDATGVVALNFVIFEVPPREIVSIRFEGNEQTRASYMLKLMGLTVGDRVRSKEVQEAVQNLGQTGLFAEVRIDEDPADEGKLALVVVVEENKTGLQRLGARYSTLQGFSLRLGIEERNFLGRGLSAGANATIGQETQTLKFFLRPPVRDFYAYSFQNGYTLDVNQDTSEDTVTSTLAWTATLKRQLKYQISERPDLTISAKSITNAGPEASVANQEEEGVVQTQAAFSYGFERTVLRRNDLPLDGTSNKISLKLTFPQTDDEWAKISGLSTYYKVLDTAERAVFSLRSSLDAVAPLYGGTLPTSVLLKNPTVLVRGFESGGLAPRERDNDNVRGGTLAFGASATLRYRLLNHDRLPIYAAIYLDAGTLYDQGQSFTYDSNGSDVVVEDSDSLRVSSGYGIVLQTAAGAITLTLSKPERITDFDKFKNFQFSFGTHL